MSLFKPFGGNRKLFQRNATSRTPTPPPQVDVTPPDAPSVAAPADNGVHDGSSGPPQQAVPAPNFAFEAEKQRQASLQSEWTQAVDTLGIADRMMTAATEARRETLADATLIAGIVRQIVERILQGAMRVDDDALVRVVIAAAEALPSDVIRLRMNPADIERVCHLLPDGMAETLVPDPKVEGGCIAQTQRASVDASHAAAIEAVDTMLKTWLSSEQP
jgi:flagellar biosynthesis/type III secretory pathway protein FliH